MEKQSSEGCLENIAEFLEVFFSGRFSEDLSLFK